MMTGAIILNGISRKKKKFYAEIHPALSEKFLIQIFETQYKGHAIALASEAVSQKFDFILAAGGDGTLNQVINGMMSLRQEAILPPLGLIPLGTGNDFARTCELKPNAAQIIGLLEAGNPKPTDVGKLICSDVNGKETLRYFLNCCSLGMGPEVVQLLETSSRKYGPTHTYIKAIITTFFKQRPPHISCRSGDWSFDGKVRVLGVANAKSFGRAVYLAPDAVLDDSLLNVFVARDVPTIKFLLYLYLLKAKIKLKNKSTVYREVKSIAISSHENCAIETEGELAGYLPAKVDVMPKMINFFR